MAVAVPTPPGFEAACAPLLSQLPGFVLGGERRVTTPDSSRTAAWGAVPVVLLCGVDQPSVPSTATLLRVDGVDWFVEPLTNGTLFTTVKRVTPVSVSVPSSYSAAPEALPGISTAVAATIASVAE